jgi:glycosyltransferase involved in cell wall biosynthesis
MKVLGLVMAYNEEEFIYYSLKSILPFCDEIVVVEGATEITKRITGKARSTDNTIAEIKRVEDPTGKIKLIASTYKDKRHAQNTGIKKRTIDPDYLLVHGGDEVYKWHGLKRMLDLIKNNSHINAVRTPFYHFWHDFWHIAYGGGWNIYQGRLYRFTPGCGFKYHYSLGDKHTDRLDNASQYYPKSVHNYPYKITSPFVFHYAFVKDESSQIDKYIFHRVREKKDKRPIKDIKKDFFVATAWSRWKLSHSMNEEPFKHIRVFKGSHPQLMEDHPKYLRFKPQ